MRNRRILTAICLLIIASQLQAQTAYPKGYFRNPLNIPMQLVANFGEIRANHWHMGLDIRTKQRENLQVFAAASGYVSRVSVEPGGFGLAIYIDHPNGMTTLYAHMNAFFPALERYVRQQQYERQSWRINLQLPEGAFPVAKGDYIGLSGNTGGSQGPHVHFEIRDTRTGKCLNPLLFGLPIADAVPPTLTRIAMYDRNRSTYAQTPQLLPIANGSAIRVGSNRISFAISATDRLSGSNNPNGIYKTRVLVNGRQVSGFTHDRIGYEDTRYINAQVDLKYKAGSGRDLQHLSPLPGATVPYDTGNEDGIIRLPENEPQAITLEIADPAGNTTRRNFTVTYDPSMARSGATINGDMLIPGQVNIIEREGFELYTTENSVYDTVAVTYAREVGNGGNAISALHRFLSAAIPTHDTVTVAIRPDISVNGNDAERLLIRNISGSRTVVQKAALHNGMIMAKFRQFGSYQAFIDREPPTVNAPATDLSRSSRIVFTPRDNFNTIKNFRVELDGQWLRFTNDKGRSWIYTFDEHFPRGNHELKVMVEDEAGNQLVRSWQVRR